MARRDPSTVGAVLHLSARLDLSGRISWWTWKDVVGDRVAERSCPDRIDEQGVLLVTVKSSLWAQELSLLAPQILAGLRRRFRGPLRALRFRVGEVRLPPRAPARSAATPRALPAELNARLEAVTDPELREAIREAASFSRE